MALIEAFSGTLAREAELVHSESNQCTLGRGPSGGALWGGGPEGYAPHKHWRSHRHSESERVVHEVWGKKTWIESTFLVNIKHEQ